MENMEENMRDGKYGGEYVRWRIGEMENIEENM